MATIAENLKSKADARKGAEKELATVKKEFEDYKDAIAREDSAQKELFSQVKRGQEEAAKEVTRLLEKNRKLKEELERRPTPEKVLEGFRGTPAYYRELNDKAVEKIQLCWDVASRYLAEVLGGPIDGFIERYINLEEEIHKTKLAIGATDATGRTEEAEDTGVTQPPENPPSEHSIAEEAPPSN